MSFFLDKDWNDWEHAFICINYLFKVGKMPAIGTLFIFSSPSGGGKTSLVRTLVNEVEDLVVSISYTTRERRTGEVDGKHYHFIDEAKFNTLLEEGEFLEHAKVYSNYYGTSKSWVRKTLEAGIDIALDIDWQGAAQIKKLFPESVSIYILPPSVDILLQRLKDRGRDSAEQIASRMDKLKLELSHFDDYDYLVVNDVFESSREQLKSLVYANRLRMSNKLVEHKELIASISQK